MPQPPPVTTRWTASPTAAVAAEQWLGAPVMVMPVEQRLLQAGRSLWNLRQFDLARRTRGARAAARLAAPGDEPGLAAGADRPGRAGRGRRSSASTSGPGTRRTTVEARRNAIQALVKQSFPRVGDADVQRDAGAVMLRETQALRTLAGKPGDGDLEPMLQAAAAAWPSERPPVENLRFEPGKLTLAASGWTDAQIEQFRGVLQPGRLPGRRQRGPDRRHPRPPAPEPPP